MVGEYENTARQVDRLNKGCRARCLPTVAVLPSQALFLEELAAYVSVRDLAIFLETQSRLEIVYRLLLLTMYVLLL